MKARNIKLTLVALSSLLFVACNDNNPYYNPYGVGYGGPCGMPNIGAPLYSATGIGTTSQNGVPAQLQLTLAVNQAGQVVASGQLNVSNPQGFFAYGPGVPMGNSICLNAQGAASWDPNMEQTASQLALVGGNIQIVFDPGVYISHNNLFAGNGTLYVGGYPYGSITFTPGGF